MRSIRTKSKAAIIFLLLFSAFLLAARLFRFAGGPPPPLHPKRTAAAAPLSSGEYTVKRAIDGDTVLLKNGERVRYLGIDTPEKNEPFFTGALKANRNLVEGKKVKLLVCQTRRRDDYGRTLAGLRLDGRDVTLELLRLGLGRVFEDRSCLSTEEMDRYFQTAIDAAKSHLGIWKNAPETPIKPHRAASFLGKTGLVCGEVKNVHTGPSAVHINFGADWKTDFSATVFRTDEKRFRKAGFAPDESLVGKKLFVFGHIHLRDGPNVVLSTPLQVKVTNDCEKNW